MHFSSALFSKEWFKLISSPLKGKKKILIGVVLM